MNKKNPLLMIGLAGLAVTFVLHMSFLLAGIVSVHSAMTVWLLCYGNWFVFVAIGVGIARRNDRKNGESI
jgi:thiosulfate reductase cytochrome b subunit